MILFSHVIESIFSTVVYSVRIWYSDCSNLNQPSMGKEPTMTQQDYLKQIDDVISVGPYQANWGSLTTHPTPEWYRKGKFGIFIHWGVYSVPGYGNEWYSRNMYDPSRREYHHHIAAYGPQKEFGYKDFIPMFKGEYFDAGRWISLFQEAGAKYILPVAEHHDGFSMYDTDFNRWNAVKMGPCRDYLGELKAATEGAGLKFCASTHRAEHYFFMNMGRTCDSDIHDEAYADFYGPAVYRPEFDSKCMSNTTETPSAIGPDDVWLTDWLVRTCELIDRYQPKVLYFDWWIQNHTFKPYLKKIAAYYYNRSAQWGVEVSINFKREAFPPGVGTFDVERGALTDISPVPWQTCTAIGKDSWGYIRDNRFKSARQIICDLIDIVSKNGMMLLNVGPRPDGTITEEETAVLQEMGRWMKINSEGIYDTTPWKWFGEGSVNAQDGFFMDGEEKDFSSADFRFTYKGGCVYAFQLRPNGKDVLIRTFSERGMYDFCIESVSLLGYTDQIDYKRERDGLHINIPTELDSNLPICFKITLA